jgi:hypothetical protein
MKTCKKGLHQYDKTLRTCPECRRISHQTWWSQHPGKREESSKSWFDRNPLYRLWKGMHERCYSPNHTGFKHYGERGITVCSEWHGEQGYLNFVRDMGERPSPHHSVDRKNNGLGYSKDNCQWATHEEQGRNKRSNVILTCRGESATLKDWSRKTGIHWETIKSRIELGWTIESALSRPPMPQIAATHGGETLTLKQWSARTGLPQRVLYHRVALAGWDHSRALTTPKGEKLPFATREELIPINV